jgi:hypothetical protein
MTAEEVSKQTGANLLSVWLLAGVRDELSNGDGHVAEHGFGALPRCRGGCHSPRCEAWSGGSLVSDLTATEKAKVKAAAVQALAGRTGGHCQMSAGGRSPISLPDFITRSERSLARP